MEGAICLDYYFELPADVTTADPIAYSPYVYIDEPKFEAAVSVEMDIILEDPIPPGRRELHDDEADKRPLPLVAALKQDLAWLASSGSRRVKPDDVMVSVSWESSGLAPTWTEKVTATIQGMRSAHHAKMVSEELADWAKDMKYDDAVDGAFDDAKGLFADKFPHVDQLIEHLSKGKGLGGLTLAGVKSIFVSEAFILEDSPATCDPSSWTGYDGVTCGECAALVNVRDNGGSCSKIKLRALTL